MPPPIPPVHVTFANESLWYLQPDIWIGAFTLLLAIATFWLGWETRELRKDSARAIAAAETNASAANRGVATSEESMRRTLRAYVTIGLIQPLEQDLQQIPHAVKITVINTGQTPASNQEVFYSFKPVSKWPQTFDVAIEHYSTMMAAVLGRDQERSVIAEHFIGDSDSQQIVDGRLFLMAYGCVRYFDMFEGAVPRYTEFSYAWDPKQELFYPVGPMNSVT